MGLDSLTDAVLNMSAHRALSHYPPSLEMKTGDIFVSSGAPATNAQQVKAGGWIDAEHRARHLVLG